MQSIEIVTLITARESVLSAWLRSRRLQVRLLLGTFNGETAEDCIGLSRVFVVILNTTVVR